MGLLTPYFVPRGGFLYTMIVPGGVFLLPSSRVRGVCPGGGGMVLDEIDTCITIFLLTGLRIYTGEYKAQGPTLCPTEGRALRGPRALYSPV